jgi:serine/threonine protein kinase
VTYANVIRRHGLSVRRSHPWAIVGETTLTQGWKLHISSVQTDAPELLQAILPTLRASAVPFKVIWDERLLGQLNEGGLGATQIGKFATIYPPSAAAARLLAGKLVQLTRRFRGPIVVTDLKLGDVVYARYGGFRPIVVRDRLGGYAPHLRDRRGRLQRDEYRIPFSVPVGRKNPFSKLHLRPRSESKLRKTGRRGKLFGPGFFVLDLVKANPKGCVYRGLDLRKQESIVPVVLKEGRQWCLSDRFGRDIRTRLRHQASVHKVLRGRVPIADAGEYFEVKGHGYLPLAYLTGRTLLQAINDELRMRPWRAIHWSRQVEMLKRLAGTIVAVRQLHSAGYVHRDLSAQNILVADDGGILLLDLELAHRLGDQSPPFGLGTAGFMSPQQQARHRPSPADDIYAIGAVILLTLTGLDPRRLVFAAPRDRSNQWRALTGRPADPLVNIAAKCMDPRVGCRPRIDEVLATVTETLASHNKTMHTSRADEAPLLLRPDVHEVRQTINGLMRRPVLATSSGLWLSEAFEENHRRTPDGSRRYQLRRSANRGVAGVLYLLGRAARIGYRSDAIDRRARRAAAWLLRDSAAPDSGMPGLHFGDAGVAVALTEAITGGLVARTRHSEAYIRRALTGTLDWPDLTHGAAGQGLAALYCGDHLRDPTISALSSRCADYLIKTQRPSGFWSWPQDVSPASRGVLTGFAHGVAGITYFLAEYARRSGDPGADRAWRRGVKWLLNQAEVVRGALTWPISAGGTERWAWWCHGSIGIAVLFLRLYEQTSEVQFAEIAKRALRIHPPEFLSVNLSQCHGYSGVGEVYLEAYRLFGEQRWRSRLQAMLHVLRNLRRSCNGGFTWLVENPYLCTADLMVGGAGVAHFFLRASLPKASIGLPLLLDPILAE